MRNSTILCTQKMFEIIKRILQFLLIFIAWIIKSSNTKHFVCKQKKALEKEHQKSPFIGHNLEKVKELRWECGLARVLWQGFVIMGLWGSGELAGGKTLSGNHKYHVVLTLPTKDHHKTIVWNVWMVIDSLIIHSFPQFVCILEYYIVHRM